MIQQTSLFNTSPQVSGFKLDYMEVWNWGTFDGGVCRLTPQGNNSLLTGANASGKSTLIDALLTLIVPRKRQRFYNQSSGAEKRGNRTEESYFFGNYAQQQDGEGTLTSMKLRGKDKRSVLLASFCNIDQREITLIQIRYFSGEELRVVYGIASKQLTIEEHFSDFDTKGLWRKHLEKQLNTGSSKRVIEFFDTPLGYEQKMLQLFGMRSAKALTLFNLIVGVKVLDDLNRFIRDNMLEQQPAEDEYTNLMEHFQQLMDAQTNIDKAKEQIRQLQLVDALAQEISKEKQQLVAWMSEKDVAVYWFANRMVILCDEELGHCNSELRKIEDQLKVNDAVCKHLNDTRSTLEASIKSDSVGQRIMALETEISQLTTLRDKRQQKMEAYSQLAHVVQLTENPDATAFASNKTKAKDEESNIQKILTYDLPEKKRLLTNENEKIKNRSNEITENVKDLLAHNNNISGRVSEIRDEIIKHVGATPKQIPFIGELICVKECEHEWEYAIERILHGFALRLLIPEEFYHRVNEYVNSHDLKGKIVYHKYSSVDTFRFFEDRTMSDNSLLKKIDLAPQSVYADWVKNRLLTDYDYACLDSQSDFNHAVDKAVTREGLIKFKGGKHEKDDRPGVRLRENYVLGWDNSEKIAAFREELNDLQSRQKENETEITALDFRMSNLEKRKQTCHDLQTYLNYDDLDWMTCAQNIHEKSVEKKNLEETNDKLKELQTQLDKVFQDLKKVESEKEELVRLQTRLVCKKDNLNTVYKENSEILRLKEGVNTARFEEKYPDLLRLDLDSLAGKRGSVQTEINAEIEKCKNAKSEKEQECHRRILAFKHPSEEIISRFKNWRSNIHNLPDSVEFVSEYQAMLAHLQDVDLPHFEDSFNSYLNDAIMHNVSLFNVFFQKWEESIKKTIELLNESLRGIDFNSHPNTYIQLVLTKRSNPDIAEFRRLLLDAVPNVHEVDSNTDGRRLHFEQHLAPLMHRLENESWRSFVMDVRGWFTYKAVEFCRVDNERRNTYESMGQLSGGEKAQLTYTILGSAIAYQFGLTKSGLDSSFRFIAIDEAFRAQDEDRSRYLISLCKQLHLQLLVVTPCDNIHIVEDDITYVHFVERKGNTSVLCNMPISKFQKERENSLI